MNEPTSIHYLTAAQVLFIHDRLIAETGGSEGIRDLGLLVAAMARSQATIDGTDLYPTLFGKAAALMASLVNNYPFVDGNKRVGITAAGLFLRLNGYRLNTTNIELERFALEVAQSRLTVGEMASWFREQSTMMD